MSKKSNSKKILINGFWRSGTSFLYLQLAKNFDDTLYEPLHPGLGGHIKSAIKGKNIIQVHPYFSDNIRVNLFYKYYQYFDNSIFDIIRMWHPNRDGIYHVVYNFDELKRYLSYFENFNIKEVSLHLYLKELSKHWDVYHVIRHPVDTFISIINAFYPTAKAIRVKLSKLHWAMRLIVNKLGGNPLYYTARELLSIYGIGDPTKSVESMPAEEAFVVSWTISNYIAVNSISNTNLIIYENLNSYKKLPFKIYDEIRPETFPKKREKYEDVFSNLTKKYNLDEEYNYLIKLFD